VLWRDRGKAPLGYIKGMAADTALAISNANSERDALAHYDSMFAARGMRNDVSGIDTAASVRAAAGGYKEGVILARWLSISGADAD
ncbi:MAG TPA: hypothetical protein VF014_14305, partial [Casimicrobiaceae bacterium]|nr:hypothetical protein [Casimicrobiaceae bacterium]